MDRHGILGESEVSDDSLNRSDRRVTRYSQTRHQSRMSESIARPASCSTSALRGAARRKRKTPRKQTKVLKEIKNLQKTTQLLIPKLPFTRLVREISLSINSEVTRYTLPALDAIQEATEMFMVQLFEDAYRLTLHRKCVTLSKGDLMLIRFLKHDF